MVDSQDQVRKPALSLKRMAPLLVLITGLIAFFALDYDRYVTLDTLSENRALLLDWVERHGPVAGLAFVAFYAVAVAISVPGGALLTITSGFLFGIVKGSFYAVIGATIGATILFLAARTGLGEVLAMRAGPAIKRMEAGVRENALSYMLVVRLVPIFPFWLVNLLPALIGVPFGIFVVTTLFGIIPATVIYSSLGNGLGAILDAGGTPDLGIIFQPKVLLPLIGLALLSLIPLVYKSVKARKGRG